MPFLVAATGGGERKWPTAVITRVPANAANVQLLPADPLRRHFLIYNGSTTQNLFISFSGPADLTAGAENFTTRIGTQGTFEWESPFGGFTGAINGIWAAADAAGEALITVLTGGG